MGHLRTSFYIIVGLALIGFITSTSAQEVAIPDPGLNLAVRQALQIPSAPLTPQDLLSLTNLSAGGRSITNVAGLETARNLRILDLDNNSVTLFTIASVLTNLSILDLFNNDLASFVLSNASRELTIIDLGFNSLTQCSLPDGLTNLDTLFMEGNVLAEFNLPSGLSRLTQLDLSGNSLTHLTVPADMKNLITVLSFANQLTNLTLPANLSRLTGLDLDFNRLPSLTLHAGLTHLVSLHVRDNLLANLTFPPDMTNLSFVDLGGNQLSTVTLQAALPHLNFLLLSDNRLSSLSLPSGLTNLASLFLQNNQLTNLSLASGLNQLVQLDLRTNHLTSLTLPPDITNLTTLLVDGNPLATLVLPQPFAAGNLASTVAALQSQGVQIVTYPLSIELTRVPQPPGAFNFAITGPPGVYAVLASTNLASWSVLDFVNNPLGSVFFTDATTQFVTRRFYRAQLLQSLTNMVFIPPTTFIMGTPPNEVNRQADEGPQTTVTISHGFWMGKYEVTQGEYQAVVGSNPSQFPGNLDRPVETVSWLDATNYCALLTQQELAAGRISPGSRYRLPTEAEWEYAARAGTTTRFSYGDDPNFTNLANHAWYSANAGFGTHPVGQKLPNPWGLYDMEGNVLEWTLDWYGPYPGGSTTDPQGPTSNPIGVKVIRGGAWDSFPADCRSGRRLTQGVHPLVHDSILGFRVALVTEP